MTPSRCRWGILGTANIARKNWKAIRNAENATLEAVASRDRKRAQHFIDECQSVVPFVPPPVACGSYEELLAKKEIDAVYIPLPTGIRKEWVVRAAEAGKHILCEKPCASTTADLREMLEACQKYGVQFMDGVMFMHSHRLPLLRQVIDDPQTLGTIRRIVSHFSFRAPEEFLKENIRVSHELEPLGCLGDLGWYNIRFTLWVMKEQLPERVTGRLLAQHGRGDSKLPVPMEFSAELFYPGGVSASFYCSFLTEIQQWGNVGGTAGYVQVPDFVLPFFGCESSFDLRQSSFRVLGCDFNMEDHARRFVVHEYSNSTSNAQETNMIHRFSKIVTSGQLEPFWAESALKTQLVLEACLKSSQENGTPVAVK